MPRVQTVTLVGAAVSTVTMNRDYEYIEVINVTGSAEVYFTVTGVNPTVGGNDCECLPAVANARQTVRAFGTAAQAVKVISTGTPKVTVRGVQ